MAQQVDLHKSFVFLGEALLVLFSVQFLRHKVLFAVDALSDLIFLIVRYNESVHLPDQPCVGWV